MYKLISITRKNNKTEKGYCNFQEWYDAMEFVNSVEKKLTGRVLAPRSEERTFKIEGGTQTYRLINIGGMA